VDEGADEVFEEVLLGDAGGVVVDAADAFAGEEAFLDEAGHHVEDGGADDAAGGGEVVGGIADGNGVAVVDELEELEFCLADGVVLLTTHVV